MKEVSMNSFVGLELLKMLEKFCEPCICVESDVEKTLKVQSLSATISKFEGKSMHSHIYGNKIKFSENIQIGFSIVFFYATILYYVSCLYFLLYKCFTIFHNTIIKSVEKFPTI